MGCGATGLERTDVEAEVGEQRAHFWKPMERGLGGQGDTRDPDRGKAQAEVMGLRGC